MPHTIHHTHPLALSHLVCIGCFWAYRKFVLGHTLDLCLLDVSSSFVSFHLCRLYTHALGLIGVVSSMPSAEGIAWLCGCVLSKI